MLWNGAIVACYAAGSADHEEVFEVEGGLQRIGQDGRDAGDLGADR